MKLNAQGIANREEWISKGYKLPEFDREAMIEATKKAPYWIHFGNGNIFKAFQANVVQNLLNSGDLDRGLTVAEGFDYEIIEKMNRPCDDLNILVTLKVDGTIDKTVIGSIAESLILDSDNEKQYSRLKEIFEQDSLRMASFTITEKGYSLVNAKGETIPAVAADYAITSDEHMDAVLNGEVGQELEGLMENTGLHVLGAITRGPRNVTSNKEIKSPADMAGFVIRTPESAMTMAAFEAMGAKPTPMAFSEIFTSLQQGVIDGQENPLANIQDGAFYEVQDYVIQTEHLRAWVYMAISKARFDSFPAEIQDAIQAAADTAIAYEHELFLAQEAELQATLESEGMTFVEVDQTPFKEAAVSGVLEVLDDNQKAIYEKIVAADPANK